MASTFDSTASTSNGHTTRDTDPLPTESSDPPTVAVPGHDDPLSCACTYAFPACAPHPKAEEILRQVDFYFSDENLPHDAHLLGLIKDGDGLVSLHEIMGFKRMRQYRPMTAVREVLKQSEVVEVVGTKRLKRKHPLTKQITVVPRVNENRKKQVVPEDKPWLTKNLLKKTGFEDYATDAPIKLEEFENDRNDYDPEIGFTHRIEVAVTRFTARRKMHQMYRAVFEKFMIFGGFDAGQRYFTGNSDDKAMGDYTKAQIAEMTSNYGVSQMVLDGYHENEKEGESTWVVDFEALAKAFLSCEFMIQFDWQNEEAVHASINVIRSFYNYLLYHDVCPEYADQIYAARTVCDASEREFRRLSQVDRHLPGDFNTACSTLFGGYYAGMYVVGEEWVLEDDKMGWSDRDANAIFLTGVAAYGSEEQFRTLETRCQAGEKCKVISEEEVGLEVVGVEFAEGEAKQVYEDSRIKDTIVQPMGKLRCVRWEMPNQPPKDLPADFAPTGAQSDKFEFLLEESTLENCYIGMKVTAVVKELDLGFKWIDSFRKVYPSFITVLPNEKIRRWKEPGPPKAWMLAQTAKENGTLVDPQAEGEGEAQDKEAELDLNEDECN